MPENKVYYQATHEEAEKKLLKSYVDLASSLFASKITSLSDEFFAEALNLFSPGRPVRKIGKYTDRGAWMDGWETRRHNTSYDWVIFRLGFAGRIAGFDIDTSHFNGNHAPAASVDACYSPECDPAHDESSKWEEVLPKVQLNADSQHFFVLKTKTTNTFTHIRLRIYPDGGVARFRVYGSVSANWPLDESKLMDLASIENEGRAVSCSDQHYGFMDNLLLPGRGRHMGDGWETKRSREPDHKDWVIVKLGKPGYLEKAEIDTSHFKGNFPQFVTLEGCLSESLEEIPTNDIEWTPILSRSKLGPNRLHDWKLTNGQKKFSHVRMTIYPDGGVMRLHVYGRRELPGNLKTQ